jgi:hypothetical protein
MAMFSDLNNLRNWFVLNDLPFYVVKKGTAQLFANFTDDSVESSADGLVSRLEMIEDAGEITILQFPKIPKGSQSKLNVDGAKVITFAKPKKQYTSDQSDYKNRSIGNVTDPAMLQLINDLREDNRAIRAEFASLIKYQQELEQADDDDDVADQAQPQDFLSAMMGNPAVQNVLTNLIANLGANLGANILTKKPTAMAGTGTNETQQNQSDEIIGLVNVLLQKGVTIAHLRKLAQMPAVKIQALLAML